MTAPVDLTNLRGMTDGDKEVEALLFEEFYASSEACIQVLENSIHGGGNEDWRKAAHALKGTSVNLGAMRLGELCKYAQEGFGAGVSEKNMMLAAIIAEYANVKTYLEAA